MNAATEGRAKRRFLSLRSAIIWLTVIVAYVLALSSYKGAMVERLARDGLQTVQQKHSKVLGLFQSSFFFFYEDQFVPGVRQYLAPPAATDAAAVGLSRIRVVSGSASEPGSVLFDTALEKTPQKGKPPAGTRISDKAVVEGLGASAPAAFARGFTVEILVPSGPYGILYTLDSSALRARTIAALLGGIVLLGLAWWLLQPARLRAVGSGIVYLRTRVFRLRARILGAIILVNVIMAVVLYVSLTTLQTREQTERIQREALVFSEFSTSQIIGDFTNFYYFYYRDRFLPEIKRILAANENLVAIRIISRRTSQVLFDSEQAEIDRPQARLADMPQAELSPELLEQLKSREQASQFLERGGERMLAVVQTYRNENREPLFWVEYHFSFHALKRSLEAIRRQILIDIVPSMGLGLALAVFFAQLLISPIRKLVDALQRVTRGDYNVTVETKNTDEVGDLVAAFNSMAAELRKKQELRKYLSDSTYRKIMQAPETPAGLKIGGSRVSATVLFSDIRNFVSHCEHLEAEEVTDMLNEYFSEMVEVVYKYGGEVDKFIGDALLAVFYAEPESRTIRPQSSSRTGTQLSGDASAMRAIYCAMEMRERLALYNKRRQTLNKAKLEIGVGISYGEIISGPIGAKDRMDFTVIGDVVNLANRIEKLSKGGRHTRIVFSNHIEEKVRGLLQYEELTREKIRGKEEEVLVYELIGIRDLETLIANVKASDADLRRRSVELLGQSRNPTALDTVLAALDDRETAVQGAAATAIAKIAAPNDDRVLNALLRKAHAKVDDRVVSACVAAIGKVCGNDRILELADLLDHANERVVANVVEALGQVRSPKAADLILPKLNSRNNRVKANTAMALFAAGRTAVVDSLKPMLMHSDHLMRSSAAFALGELTVIAAQEEVLRQWREDPRAVKVFLAELQECVPMLVSLLRDPEPIVKRQAVIALGKIKDRSAVLPIIDMMDPSTPRELARDVLDALRSIGSHSLVREVISKLS